MQIFSCFKLFKTFYVNGRITNSWEKKCGESWNVCEVFFIVNKFGFEIFAVSKGFFFCNFAEIELSDMNISFLFSWKDLLGDKWINYWIIIIKLWISELNLNWIGTYSSFLRKLQGSFAICNFSGYFKDIWDIIKEEFHKICSSSSASAAKTFIIYAQNGLVVLHFSHFPQEKLWSDYSQPFF